MLNVKGLTRLSNYLLFRRVNKLAWTNCSKSTHIYRVDLHFSTHIHNNLVTKRELKTRMDSVSAATHELMRARKEVVTAFIRKRNTDVLLVRRSDKVGSYRNYWGGISGGVEGSESLVRRAEIEVRSCILS
jgi:uncharacterized glyoxalase superfamily metalloenzyme YdcJ